MAPPFVTFERRLDIHVGELRVELHHVGTAAHTTNDVVAWIPEHRLLFAGDLVFNGGTPFVLMGSVAGSLVGLDYVAELDAAVIVPGHGEVCGPEVVDVAGEYLRFLQGISRGGAPRRAHPPRRRPPGRPRALRHAGAPRTPGRQPAPGHGGAHGRPAR